MWIIFIILGLLPLFSHTVRSAVATMWYDLQTYVFDPLLHPHAPWRAWLAALWHGFRNFLLCASAVVVLLIVVYVGLVALVTFAWYSNRIWLAFALAIAGGILFGLLALGWHFTKKLFGGSPATGAFLLPLLFFVAALGIIVYPDLQNLGWVWFRLILALFLLLIIRLIYQAATGGVGRPFYATIAAAMTFVVVVWIATTAFPGYIRLGNAYHGTEQSRAQRLSAAVEIDKFLTLGQVDETTRVIQVLDFDSQKQQIVRGDFAQLKAGQQFRTKDVEARTYASLGEPGVLIVTPSAEGDYLQLPGQEPTVYLVPSRKITILPSARSTAKTKPATTVGGGVASSESPVRCQTDWEVMEAGKYLVSACGESEDPVYRNHAGQTIPVTKGQYVSVVAQGTTIRPRANMPDYRPFEYGIGADELKNPEMWKTAGTKHFPELRLHSPYLEIQGWGAQGYKDKSASFGFRAAKSGALGVGYVNAPQYYPTTVGSVKLLVTVSN